MSSVIGAVVFTAFALGCLLGASQRGEHQDSPDDRTFVHRRDRFRAYCRQNRDERRYHPNPNIFWSRRTFWAVVAYTGITSALFGVSYCSLQATKTIADTARDTEERQLRAYVGMVGDTTLKCPACDAAVIGKPLSLDPGHIADNANSTDIQNGGQTPAYDVVVWDNYWPVGFNQGLPPDFKYPDIPVAPGMSYNNHSSVGMLNPGEREPSKGYLQLSVINLIAEARHHLISLYYYGHIDYKDVFVKERSTPFCMEYLPDERSSPFADCPGHNNPKEGK